MFHIPDWRTFTLFVHISGAVVLIGSSLVSPLTRAAIRKSRTLGELRSWLGFAQTLARPNPFAALTVLATGVYLGSAGWWHSGWFSVALVAFVCNAVVAATVVKPLGMQIGRHLGGDEHEPVPEAADALRNTPRWPFATGLMLANDFALLYLMLAKPSLGESFALLVMVNLAAAVASGVSVYRRGQWLRTGFR